MSSSVLGKRTRSPICADSTGIQTRAKRRSIAILGNDENCNPFVLPRGEAPSVSTPAKAVSRPAKHGAPQSRVGASPNTINSHFAVTKKTLEVENDGKKPALISTPQTPRHRDALSKKVAVTPRHRVQISNPTTPRGSSTPKSPLINVYNQARQVFARCTDSGVLIGREEERQQLSNFVSDGISSQKGGCLYISGPPGTGKSAFVGRVCQDLISSDRAATSTVNCMSVKSAKDLATTLSEDLNIIYESGRGAEFDFLRRHFLEHGAKKYIVVLDEIDRLVDLNLKLLYSLFEWSMLPSSNLILIGIANALDLTDRLLPRLKSRNLKPELLPFMPYTAPQIADVITEKLKGLMDQSEPTNHVPFLHPAAIQFCSKKVASQTGDLRKAFDICRRAIDLAEQDAKAEQARLCLLESPSKTPLMENINLSSPPVRASPIIQRQTKLTSSLSHLSTLTAPRATIAHMARVTAQVFSNGTSQRLTTLNLQQKAVLCALSALEKKRREAPSSSIFATPSKNANAAPTVKQLFEAYSTLCKRENLLHPLTSMEFRDVVSGLETLSLVSAVEGKGGSFALPITPSRTPSRKGKGGFSGAAVGDERRMAGCVGYGELAAALQGPGSDILREILEGDVEL
ncbi:hypothetical protein MBLNU459_g0264t1 [Dothideomycetes sp. NU459]